MRIVHFHRSHAEQVGKALPEPDAAKLEAEPFAWTVLDGDRVLAYGGVVRYWPGRGDAWAVVIKTGRVADALKVHKASLLMLAACPLHRIEAAVDLDFKAGHRWTQALGFALEAPVCRKFSPSGNDCSLYARIK